MRALRTQVRGVPPAIVAPVGGANPGDGCNSPSLLPTTRPRPSPCPPTGPGRIGGGGEPLRRPRLFKAREGPRMEQDGSLQFSGSTPESFMRLLIIEDDRDAADYLVKAFREVGHVADAAADGEDGLALALDGGYDVLIVDRMLPKRDGLSVIGTLRAKGIQTPGLILSALGQVDDRVKGLRAGGDDYLAKPYSFAELLARVEVLARRRGGRGEETVYRVADLELDRLSHRVTRGEQEIDLQPREFR